MLRKYILDPSLVLREQPVELKEDLSYDEEAVRILDRKEQVLRNKTVPLVKVLWRHHGVEEATWELKDQMKKRYSTLSVIFDREGKVGVFYAKSDILWSFEFSGMYTLRDKLKVCRVRNFGVVLFRGIF
ncbi:Chromo domain-containing protein [Cucumis melo var. makuwa]|uniref:Chromo domain-containing protein n=1 Tax=Cucumis melo var. makuwa TaxID=1194695 RepID=A0A5D3BLZ3_CUCMM|nr:Chromo domain-containing protein [Cucumis melo var. makuwa]